MYQKNVKTALCVKENLFHLVWCALYILFVLFYCLKKVSA